MASKSTNGTILTLAVVGVGGYIAIKMFGGRKTQAATGSVGSVAGAGEGDYYAPYDQQQQPSTLQSIMQGLQNLLQGKGGGSGLNGGGGGSSAGGGKNSAAAPNAAATGSGGGADLWNSLEEGLFGGQVVGDFSNPELGGESLYSDSPGLNLESTLSSSDLSIPYENDSAQLDVPGTFITDSSDGSANAIDTLDSGAGGFAEPIESSDLGSIDSTDGGDQFGSGDPFGSEDDS